MRPCGPRVDVVPAVHCLPRHCGCGGVAAIFSIGAMGLGVLTGGSNGLSQLSSLTGGRMPIGQFLQCWSCEVIFCFSFAVSVDVSDQLCSVQFCPRFPFRLRAVSTLHFIQY